jgi:hypothetical protein
MPGPRIGAGRKACAAVVPHPIIGVAFPHRWHRSGMFARTVAGRPLATNQQGPRLRLHLGQVAQVRVALFLRFTD